MSEAIRANDPLNRDPGIAQATAALADDLMVLARMSDRELDASLLATLRKAPPRDWFALALAGAEFDEASRLVATAFAAMPDPVDAATLDRLAAEFAAIYLTHHYRAAPTESVWRDDEGLERQQAMFAVRDWYKRYRVSVPDWRKRSDDHLVHELEFLAFLLRDADDEAALRAGAQFMSDHLLVWVKPFAATVVQRCREPLYAGLVLVTAIYLDHLAALIGDLLGITIKAAAAKPPAALGGTSGGKAAKTCADPPDERYVPGAGPGW